MEEIIKFDSISHSVSAINEDFTGATDDKGWILDGATSISGRRKDIHGKIETDASWFVRRFSEELKLAPSKIDTIELAKQILDKLLIEARFVWGEWHADPPSSSFTHVTAKNGIATFINLGDCRLLYQIDYGPIKSFGSSGVATLDQELLSEYCSVRNGSKKLSHSSAWNFVIPTIRKNRNRMNTPKGYWILSPTGEGLDHSEQMSVKYQNKLRILLITDGLYRLIDTYFQIGSDDFFEQAFKKNGLQTLLKKLRNVERNDPDCLLYPRVKLQDDATALSIDIER